MLTPTSRWGVTKKSCRVFGVGFFRANPVQEGWVQLIELCVNHQMYAVGSKSHTDLLDSRTLQVGALQETKKKFYLYFLILV